MKPEEKMSHTRIRASVVIPTFNRLLALRECIDSILRCQEQERLLEVVVVDNSSDDGTPEFLRELSKTNEKIVPASIPQRNAILARNLGFYLARGDVIIHIDDDIVVDRIWLKTLLSPYENKGVGAVGGRLLPESERPTPRKRRIVGRISPWGQVFANFDSSEPRRVEFLHGSNMSIRADLLRDIGGLDPNFKTNWRDDTDICAQVKKRGYVLIYEPRAIAYHKAMGSQQRFRTGQDLYKYFWNRQYFYIKNVCRPRNSAWMIIFLVLEALLCSKIFLATGDREDLALGMKGIVQGISDSLRLTKIMQVRR